jgi:hypothetical protein
MEIEHKRKKKKEKKKNLSKLLEEGGCSKLKRINSTEYIKRDNTTNSGHIKRGDKNWIVRSRYDHAAEAVAALQIHLIQKLPTACLRKQTSGNSSSDHTPPRHQTHPPPKKKSDDDCERTQ